MNAISRFLFTKIDNAALLIFRIFFGCLIALECYGAILTGWVKHTLIDPEFTFNFIGFDWLQPLPGIGMYLYFFIMGTLGVCVALGYKYRFSIMSFTLLWTAVYLMQKTSYNNHYYLLILISAMMSIFPAHAGFSLDVKQNSVQAQNSMFSYVKWAIVAQLLIVYTFAAVAKLYNDWLDFSVIKLLLLDKADYYIIGDLLQQEWLHKLIGIAGIGFDLFIIPALLWKPSRKIAFFCAIFFHLFNAVVFQIGIFPFLSLAFTVFFFEPDAIRRLFFKNNMPFANTELRLPAYKNLVLSLAIIYFSIQLLLPIRHYFIKDDVLWTEEGHRMSWRMMLRVRQGTLQFKVVDHSNGKIALIKPKEHLSIKQARRIAAYPDFIWQFAQRIKKEYANNGQRVSVYAENSKVSVNRKPYRAFIDPKVDLANVPWQHFSHHEWIYPSAIAD